MKKLALIEVEWFVLSHIISGRSQAFMPQRMPYTETLKRVFLFVISPLTVHFVSCFPDL